MSPLQIGLIVVFIIVIVYYGTAFMSPIMGTWHIDADNSINLTPSLKGVSLTINTPDKTEQKHGILSGYHTACFYDSNDPSNDLRICLVPGKRHVAMLMNDTATLASATPPKSKET